MRFILLSCEKGLTINTKINSTPDNLNIQRSSKINISDNKLNFCKTKKAPPKIRSDTKKGNLRYGTNC